MGILERLEEEFKIRVFEHTVEKYGAGCPVPIVSFENVAWLVGQHQDLTLQPNLLICGENGVGKSFCTLMLMKVIQRQRKPDWTLTKADNIVYAFQNHKDFIKAVAEHHKDVVQIDEAGEIFGYRSQMSIEQTQAYSFIEVSRENANALLFCSKDYHTLNYNLRNGKITLIIWLYDREVNGKVKSMGIVFMASAIMQGEDRFGLEPLKMCKGWNEWKLTAEQSPSFIGLFEVPDISTILDKEEIEFYAKQKTEGINKLKEKRVDAMQTKEEMSSARIMFMKERLKAFANKNKRQVERVAKLEAKKPKRKSAEEQAIADANRNEVEQMYKPYIRKT
jgi:hypothetical protein